MFLRVLLGISYWRSTEKFWAGLIQTAISKLLSGLPRTIEETTALIESRIISGCSDNRMNELRETAVQCLV